VLTVVGELETLTPWLDVPDKQNAVGGKPEKWLKLLDATSPRGGVPDVLASWRFVAVGDKQKKAKAYLGERSDKSQKWFVWGALEFGFAGECDADLVCTVRGEWSEGRSDLYIESTLTLDGCQVRESASFDEVDEGRLDAEFGIKDASEDRLARDSAPLRIFRGHDSPGRRCTLTLTQRTYPGRNAVTRLMVRSPERSPFGSDSVVLQTRPFFVAQAERAHIEPEAGDLLASWTSNDPEGAQWRVPDSTVSMLMPPQAVGEAMERGARFWQREAGPAGNEPRPWIDPARPILYRFAPPTRLEVRPSLRQRRYNVLPGNLGAALRDAKVTRFTTEMVYPVRIDFEVDEQGLPDIRIGETAGFLGRPAENLEPLPKVDTEGGEFDRWLLDAYSGNMGRYANAFTSHATLRGELVALRDAQTAARCTFAARLAQFHMYDPWSAQGGLSLVDQLTMRIRDRKRGAPPLLNPLPTWKLNPDPTGAPQLLESDLSQPQKDLIPDFLSDEGAWGTRGTGALPAGIVHTIEFASELVAVLRSPIATSGRIDTLAFSALGASGHMSASFDEDRTTFIAETSFGQLSRLVKIRIGRLGVLWNKARHVVVYERTTVASEQFKDEQLRPPIGDASHGWPVLRKTQEYIEPIEPLRAFEAEEQKDKNRAAFLDSSEVITPRIYVNGAWGCDLGHGYEIPLWNARDASGFYPRPLLALRARAGSDALTRCWLREPEHLVFYSNTQPGTGADSNRWAAFANVDCPGVLARLPRILPELGTGELLKRDSIPAPSQDGLRRPRFDLAVQADGKVNLQHGRGATQMLAVPEVLGVMRSAATGMPSEKDVASMSAATIRNLVDQVTKSAEVQKATQVAAQAERALAKLLGRIALAPASCKTFKEECETTIKQIFERARSDLGQAVPAMAPALGASTVRPLERAVDALHKQWRAQESVLRAPFERVHADLDQLSRAASTMQDSIRAKAIAQLKSARELANAAVQAQRRSIDDQLRTFGTVAGQSLLQAMTDLQGAGLALRELCGMPWPGTSGPALAEVDRLRRVIGPLERHPLLGQTATELNRGLTVLTSALSETDVALSRGWTVLGKAAGGFVDVVIGKTEIVGVAPQFVPGLVDHIQAFAGPLDIQVKKLRDSCLELESLAQHRWDAALAALERPMVEGLRLAGAEIGRVHDAATARTDRCADLIATHWRHSGDVVIQKLRDAAAAIDDHVLAMFNTALDLGRTVAQSISSMQAGVDDKLAVLQQKALESIDEIDCDKIGDVVRAAERMADRVRQIAAQVEQDLRARATEVVGSVLDAQTRQRLAELEADVARRLPQLANQAGEAIKLVKAFGELPELPTLTFNADRAEYFFDDFSRQIETSPFAAKLREIDGGLKALGLAVPAKQLLDQIIPDSLKGVDFSSVFRQFGGIDFGQLLQRFKLPDLRPEQVCITQGVDKSTRTAWIAARVNTEFPGPEPLFEIAGVSVSLAKMSLKAASDLRVGLNGERQASTDAVLRADWGLNFGGAPLATFHEVAVRFDGSKFGFDIEPSKIELHPALKFIDEFAKRFKPDLPPAVQLAFDGRGIPRGAKANLVTEVRLPPLGAIEIGPLRIASGLALMIADDGGFNVDATLDVGSKSAPIWVQIGYLGGGLWLEARASYVGTTGQMRYFASVGVALGCIRAVGFAGVAYGSFALLLFVQAEISNSGGVLRAGMSVSGSARIMGMVNASVYLLLEAVHRDGRTEGHGTLDVSVKICWCYTLRVRREVTHNIG